MSIKRFTILTVAVAMGVAGLVTAAHAQQSCDWYAKTALQQQQENEQKKCGFTGPAWNSDLKSHQAWCASQPPDAWRSEAQKRAKQLEGCAKK
jgi:hypothetical protein